MRLIKNLLIFIGILLCIANAHANHLYFESLPSFLYTSPAYVTSIGTELTVAQQLTSELVVAQPDLLTIARDGTLTDVLSVLSTADANGEDIYGQTPLMYAATGNEDPEVITALVNAGADVNATSLAGWTPLMYAVRDNPNPEVVLRLLDLGADPKTRNSEGRRALDYSDANPTFLGTNAHTRLVSLTNVSPPPPPQPSQPPTTPPSYNPPSQACCKICRKGKACGNSCISRSYTCHKGPGCACNAGVGTDDTLIAAEEHFFTTVNPSVHLGFLLDDELLTTCELPTNVRLVLQ